MKILIVDDEEDIIDVILLYLEGEGLSVDSCLDFETACEKLSNQSYDFVLSDYFLGGKTGPELYKKYKDQIKHFAILTGEHDFTSNEYKVFHKPTGIEEITDYIKFLSSSSSSTTP